MNLSKREQEIKKFNRLSPSKKERMLLQDPATFIHLVFNYQIEPPHRAILTHYEQSQQTLDLAPRGVGKTRIGDIGYAAYKAVNNPNIRILIVSDTDTHATKFLNTIKNTLERSEILKCHYGNLKGDKWTDHEIVLSTRSEIYTEATITAMGAYSGAVTSLHTDIIIADDLCNFDNSRTEVQRERMKDWYKTSLLPVLLPGGEIRCVGTRYHYSDLWDMIINALHYDTQIQEAEKDGISIWEEHMPINDRMEDGKNIVGLNSLKEDLGQVIYALQYMNNVKLLKEGSIFKYDWFCFYESPPSGLIIFQGVDPAISKSAQADFFAICTLGIDSAKNIYVLDITRGHYSFDEQVKLIKRKYDEWKPRILGIEQVSYQEALIQHLRDAYPTMRIEAVKTVKDKVSRAYNRSGLFENGKIFIRSNMHLFVDELTLFPDGTNDDMFDAFDFAMFVTDGGGGIDIPATAMSVPGKRIPDLGGSTEIPGL